MPMLFHRAAVLAALAIAAPASAQPAATRFSVMVEGAGPDVILVPGLASSRSVWRATADRLRARHRVHLVEVAGFAGSPAGDNADGPVVAPLVTALADYIKAGGLKAPAVIGHSLGGEVVLMLAARHPETIGRGMVVDALPFVSLLFDPAATVEKATPGAAQFRDAMLAATPEQGAASQAATIDRLVKTVEAKPRLIADGLASNPAVVAQATYDLMTTDLRPELPRIRAPITIVYAHDLRFGVPAATIDGVFGTAYAGLAGARLQRIDESFHFIMIDQPERLATAIDAFLKP